MSDHLHNGKMYNLDEMNKHQFTKGYKFLMQGEGYSDVFEIIEEHNDISGGTRLMNGSMSGQVSMPLRNLQRLFIDGGITDVASNVASKTTATTVVADAPAKKKKGRPRKNAAGN